jgi:hypothetical protein
VQAVVGIAQKRSVVSRTDYRVDVKSPTSVEVYSGSFSRSGDLFVMEKRKGRWFVVSAGRWPE